MSEYTYTYKDIIIDPNSEEAKNAIGKKCYMHDSPTKLLEIANNDEGVITLKSIDEKSEYPFKNKEFEIKWACIIVKKEKPKPKYVPFESAEEFVKEYRKHIRATDNSIEDTLHCCGMWIRNKCTNALCQVVFIVETGVRIGGQNYGIDWNTMHKDFEFLDGSPCGKEVKE